MLRLVLVGDFECAALINQIQNLKPVSADSVAEFFFELTASVETKLKWNGDQLHRHGQ